MQPAAEKVSRLSVAPFSILGRIGGDATCGCYGYCNCPPAFQYPRSDRRRCNARKRLVGILVSDPFSILGRIGGDATTPRTSPFPLRRHLSVSSVGSEAMQLLLGGAGRCGGGAFQYPRSDRRRCNLPSMMTRRAFGSSFSILGRIGGDATQHPGLPEADDPGFQYPRSDRRRCNCTEGTIPYSSISLSVSSVGSEAMQLSGPRASPVMMRSFQYPRSDRRRCNQIIS